MQKVIGVLSDGAVVEDILIREVDGVVHHYRIGGGADDGREFRSLPEMGEYLTLVRPGRSDVLVS
ncbi:MAG: hypothetical protein QOG01_4121 [Pseudonocardiales bacterium]|jgi:hypothetical protein|nr:hypothetical protein [Pseudonocardiales bacterium]